MIVAVIVVLFIIAVLYYTYVVYLSKKSEVYLITSSDGSYQTSFTEALAVAQTFDPSATLATTEQLAEAQAAGAQWCSTGWAADGIRRYPMQVTASGCGSKGIQTWGNDGGKGNVLVYGVKPTLEDVAASGSKLKILPFYVPATWAGDTNPVKWSQWSP